jgi:hypothetical protein
MLWLKLVDNVKPAFTADDFVIGTDFLNTGTHFHADRSPSEIDSLLLYY